MSYVRRALQLQCAWYDHPLRRVPSYPHFASKETVTQRGNLIHPGHTARQRQSQGLNSGRLLEGSPQDSSPSSSLSSASHDLSAASDPAAPWFGHHCSPVPDPALTIQFLGFDKTCSGQNQGSCSSPAVSMRAPKAGPDLIFQNLFPLPHPHFPCALCHNQPDYPSLIRPRPSFGAAGRPHGNPTHAGRRLPSSKSPPPGSDRFFCLPSGTYGGTTGRKKGFIATVRELWLLRSLPLACLDCSSVSLESREALASEGVGCIPYTSPEGVSPLESGDSRERTVKTLLTGCRNITTLEVRA